MATVVRGKAFVVGDNVDTDQIIPAEFLSYNPADAEERGFDFQKMYLAQGTLRPDLIESGNPDVSEEFCFVVYVCGI